MRRHGALLRSRHVPLHGLRHGRPVHESFGAALQPQSGSVRRMLHRHGLSGRDGVRSGQRHLHLGASLSAARCDRLRPAYMKEEQIVAAVGEEGIGRLTAAFYRQVYDDEILGPMYPERDRQGAEQRLRDFLIYRLGGSNRYIEQRGHPRLRARHSPFRIDQAARDRWMELMGRALTESAFPADAEACLRQFLDQMATFMINQD